MAQRLDSLVQDYGGSPITLPASGIWNGPILSLQGATGCSVQIYSPNTAAGTIFILTTNFYGYPPGLFQTGGYQGLPVYNNAGSGNFTAGGSQTVGANINNNATFLANWWVSIQSSAAGTVYIAVNTRRGT